MSTQYKQNFYCKTNQDTSYWSDITINLKTPTTLSELIKPEVYNEMINALKSIHDFGESDTAKKRKPYLDNFIDNKNNLVYKNKDTIIDLNYYKNIADTLSAESHSKEDNIYGTYFTNLKTIIEKYKVPSTRYYTTTQECCDCHGECSHCDYSPTPCMCIDCDDIYCGGAQMGRG